jgi:hypothetical protein
VQEAKDWENGMGMGKVMLTRKRALNTQNGLYVMTNATSRSIGLGTYTTTHKIPHIVRGVRRGQWWRSCLLGWYAQEMVLAWD